MKFNKETVSTIGAIKLAGGPITSGTITEPIALIDLVLPAGFVGFTLKLYGLTCDTAFLGGEVLSYLFSADGGATFYDQDDDYYIVGVQNNPAPDKADSLGYDDNQGALLEGFGPI